jgi:hypothetical protein
MADYFLRIVVSAALVAVLGAVGGLFNALLSDNQFVFPRGESDGKGGVIWKPGSMLTVLVGAFAALVSWALYGPISGYSIFGLDGQKLPDLTFGALGSAALIGYGGARWLTNEADKKLLRAAAVEAAGKQADAGAAQQIAAAAPARALEVARNMP